jgi:hypothetical protein
MSRSARRIVANCGLLKIRAPAMRNLLTRSKHAETTLPIVGGRRAREEVGPTLPCPIRPSQARASPCAAIPEAQTEGKEQQSARLDEHVNMIGRRRDVAWRRVASVAMCRVVSC